MSCVVHCCLVWCVGVPQSFFTVHIVSGSTTRTLACVEELLFSKKAWHGRAADLLTYYRSSVYQVVTCIPYSKVVRSCKVRLII